MNKAIQGILPFLILTLLACQKKEIPLNDALSAFRKSLDPVTDSLFQEILDTEHSDLSQLKRNVMELKEVREDKHAQVLGEYYYRKWEYLSYGDDLTADSLDAFYDDLSHEYTYFKVDMDYELYSYSKLNDRSDRLERMNEILTRQINYIVQPEYELQRAAIIYKTNPLECGIAIKGLEELLAKYESTKFDYYKSILYTYLMQFYFGNNDVENGEKIFKITAKKCEENQMLDSWAWLSAMYFISAKKDIDDIHLLQDAIQLSHRLGNLNKAETFCNSTANYYFTASNYEAAREYYTKAINFRKSIWNYLSSYKGLDQDSNPPIIFSLYIALSKCSQFGTLDNYNEVKSTFDEFINHPNRTPLLEYLATVRKSWCLEPLIKEHPHLQAEYEEMKKEVEALEKPRQLINQNNKYQQATNNQLVAFLIDKDRSIGYLEDISILNSDRIRRQVYVIVLSILCILLLIGFTLSYRQKYISALNIKKKNKIINKQLTELQLSNDKIEQQLKDIETLNSDLESANTELKKFAGIVSHDLRTPLMSIRGFSQILLSTHDSKSKSDEFEMLTYINKSGDRMLQLINDLLLLTKIQNKKDIKVTELSLNEVISDILKELSIKIEQKQAKIQVDDLPVTNANRTMIFQLFQNLISNSIKYSKEEIPPKIEITFEKHSDTNIIKVKDNGIGFDREQNTKIFDPFVRLHTQQEYEGTGLGLATCARVVELHHGQITMDSTAGVGTIATVELPTSPH